MRRMLECGDQTNTLIPASGNITRSTMFSKRNLPNIIVVASSMRHLTCSPPSMYMCGTGQLLCAWHMIAFRRYGGNCLQVFFVRIAWRCQSWPPHTQTHAIAVDVCRPTKRHQANRASIHRVSENACILYTLLSPLREIIQFTFHHHLLYVDA